MTERYTYPTPVQRAEVNEIIDDAMARAAPLGEVLRGDTVSFEESVRMVRQVEAACDYLPHRFEAPNYVDAEDYMRHGRENIVDAAARIPGFELDKRTTSPRKERHVRGVVQIERTINAHLETFDNQARPMAASLMRQTAYAIINTGIGMTRAAYRQRRDTTTAYIAQPRWRLVNKVASGQLTYEDIEDLQAKVDSVDRTAILPNFYELQPSEQGDILNVISSDARAVCDFATEYGLLSELASTRPHVLLRPGHDLRELYERFQNPRSALIRYFSLPQAQGVQLMPVTNLKPGEAVRVSRSQLSAERFGFTTRDVFLAAGLQLYQRFGDFYARPRVAVLEWAEADPVKKLAQNYFGNFRQTIIQAAPLSQDRARAVIPAYSEHSTPDRLIRRYFVTAQAKQRGLQQPLPRAVEAFVYVRRAPNGERATVSLATGRLIEGVQIVNELTKSRKLVAELSTERGMLKPAQR